MSATPYKKIRVGEVLLQAGLVNEQQLQRALEDQKSTGQMLGEMLVEQGVITSAALVRAIADCLGVRGCHLRHGLIDPSLLQLIGEEEAERLKVIPLFRVRDVLTVAMAEPQSLPTIDRLRAVTGCRIRPVFALEGNILEYIRKYAGGNVDVDEFLTSLAQTDVEVVERETVDEGPSTDLDKMVAGSPIVNLVNVALLTAVKDRASDIHIEPDKRGTRIRYRIDGVLRDLMKPPPGMHAAIVSRVKVIGKMDIAEKRLPQEGRVRIVAEGREIDLRVSSLPTLLGEKLVVRILDKQNLRVRLEDLGFRQDAMETFKRILRQSHGLVLVTGPTGSGKTTTLYSALDLLRSPERNIITVEDPVEYQLDLVNQTGVNESIGLTFARCLRSIIRQDPDIIMVGEIRDEETARVAVQAALTGHGVLATLHTNDAPGAVARLLDMNVESYLLSSALNGAVAQRLARTICSSCETKYYPAEHVLRDAGLDGLSGRAFKKGAGCQSCHNSGYHGRLGVYEVMEVTSDVRQLIYRAVPSHELRRALKTHGYKSLREEGVLLALDGKTSLEEVLRVTKTDEGGDDVTEVAPAVELRRAA
ncbi:MAG: type II secretion system protein GspE [Leptolyngbya sp. PLA2]|nr:type II secretion system protein GspE [Leptolyngbya sp.]MCE7970802.1 type II secretion system protein GspE [Leptolyngbya sp. PL-A2]MCQ3939957.1 type II secretion system protein GspE [cyanobacterium CYA1]MDL1903298.1 type II secretion system protein GspE [Synechococcales cyanobacterium CNB]